jgi:hypothetical protein
MDKDMNRNKNQGVDKNTDIDTNMELANISLISIRHSRPCNAIWIIPYDIAQHKFQHCTHF